MRPTLLFKASGWFPGQPALKRLGETLRPLADAWLPASCALCSLTLSGPRAPGAGICASCAKRLPGVDAQRCPVCAIRLPTTAQPQAPCADCVRSPPAFDQTIVLADYAPPLDRLIVALKFGSDLPAAQALGRLLAERARQQGCALPGLLVPVPLAPRRLARRGYNQSERLARTLAGTLGLDLASQGLLRTHETAPQSGLTLKARRHNLDDAFSANRQFFNCDVGLVDDVMTSGATLQVIAATLKQAGARRVVNLVVARTP